MLLLSPLSHFISLSLSNFFLLRSALSSSILKPIQFQHFLPFYLKSICFHQKKKSQISLLWIPSSLFLSSHISLSCSRLALELGLVRGHGMEIGGLVYRWIMGQVVAWVWIGGDWLVANVVDDGSLKIADDGPDVVWCWRRCWRHWSGGLVGQMVSPIWVLCVFCSEAWIDFYLLGSDGLDVAVIWWFFFFP